MIYYFIVAAVVIFVAAVAVNNSQFQICQLKQWNILIFPISVCSVVLLYIINKVAK